MLKVIKYALFLSLGISSFSYAQIEKWVDENGKTHYGTRAPSGSGAKNVDVPVFQSVKPTAKKERVILYSTTWCPYCKKARAYLNKNRIAFIELYIEKDASAKRDYDAAGGRGVPFLVKGGKTQAGFKISSYDAFFKG